MNGKKFENVLQKISSMQFIKSKSEEAAAKFDSIKNLESAIQSAIKQIDSERREIDREISSLKTPNDEPLETVSFDAMPQEAQKILAEQAETLQRIAAEQLTTEKIFDERKKIFAEKKSELHEKFLRLKAKGR